MTKIDLLRQYVCASSEPWINKSLRAGTTPTETRELDSLMTELTTDKELYRFIDSKFATKPDNAYKSFSSSFDSYIGHSTGSELACLVLPTGSKIQCIDVNKFLSDVNNENEIILSRSTQYKIVSRQQYYPSSFDELLSIFDSYESAKSLIDIYHINSITVYYIHII